MPTELDCHRWLKSLGVKNGEAVVISYSNYRKRLTLKLREPEIFEKFVDQFAKNALIYEKDGIQHLINYFICNGKKKIVKVNEIPHEINLKEFLAFFTQFGRVLNHSWDDLIPNSDLFVSDIHRETLIIEAELDKDIPSFIFFQGEKFQVNYVGQPQTCSICQSPSHKASDCPNRRPLISNLISLPTYNANFPPLDTPISALHQPGHSRWVTPFPAKTPRSNSPIAKQIPLKNRFSNLSDSSNTDDDSEQDENTVQGENNHIKKRRKSKSDRSNKNKKIAKVSFLEKEMQKIAAPNIVPTTLTPLTPVEIISAQTSNLDMEVIEFTSSIQTPNLVSLFQNDPTITSISLP